MAMCNKKGECGVFIDRSSFYCLLPDRQIFIKLYLSNMLFKFSVADKSDVTYLRLVDVSLKSSLQRVVTAYGNHLKALNLPEEHVCTIRMVCQTDDV
uniref:FERM domain-containing protein n=2 Tax=Caenorhabditis tropicalis TaxID=1561998 RepID=A0A1I7T5G4_9PELO